MEIDLKNLTEFDAVIGCDEVGRGPIAGPVVGCAAKVTKKHQGILAELIKLNITDSKKLTSKKRQIILAELGINVLELELGIAYTKNIGELEYSFCIQEHSHAEIDEMNILRASLSAMQKASKELQAVDSKILIDGNKVFESTVPTEAIIKGDSKVVVIGLASIIAKEFRDEKMKILDKKYPGYNLGKHAGYPTKEHRDAVKQLGPSQIHRKTFKGVKEYL